MKNMCAVNSMYKFTILKAFGTNLIIKAILNERPLRARNINAFFFIGSSTLFLNLKDATVNVKNVKSDTITNGIAQRKKNIFAIRFIS